MHPSIHLLKIWYDDDMVELKVTTCDGQSTFSNTVYLGLGRFDTLIADLEHFKDQVYGGIYNIEIGGFGPEYGNGAFHARLHFQERGKIYVTAHAQSSFVDFGRKNVASEATLYFVSEPALLDNFIAELRSLKAGARDNATLQGA